MKSYFCQKCGREYKHSECLRNGDNMFCFDCPTTRVRISGAPYVLIGLFLGLMFFIIRHIIKEGSAGAEFLFVPASVGMIIIGVLRIYQQRHRWQITLESQKVAADAKNKKDHEDSSEESSLE